jgi:hypothetical protein
MASTAAALATARPASLRRGKLRLTTETKEPAEAGSLASRGDWSVTERPHYGAGSEDGSAPAASVKPTVYERPVESCE